MVTPALATEAVQRTAIEALPAVPVTPVGALGTARGVTAFDTPAAPLPNTFVATTEKV
jgi:hypothetical protein